MSELKGLASQDPMKNELDRNTYNNEFKDLQMQLYDISQMTFNGVSLFANYTSNGTSEVLYNGMKQLFHQQQHHLLLMIKKGARKFHILCLSVNLVTLQHQICYLNISKPIWVPR